MRKLRLLVWLSAMLTATALVYANLNSPPPGRTGAPGEGTCAGSGCHNSFPVNSGPGGLYVDILDYLPADTLVIGVAFRGTGGTKWGFEATASRYTGDTTWEIIPIDVARTQILVPPDSGRYIAHTASGTVSDPPDTTISWQFKAVVPAPSDDNCPVVYVAGIMADGDNSPAGDYAYRAVGYPEVGSCSGCIIALTGDINLSGTVTSADIIALIGFVFRGGSHPLPCDAAADVDCNGTITSSDIIGLVNYVFKGGTPPCDACDLSPLIWKC